MNCKPISRSIVLLFPAHMPYFHVICSVPLSCVSCPLLMNFNISLIFLGVDCLFFISLLLDWEQ